MSDYKTRYPKYDKKKKTVAFLKPTTWFLQQEAACICDGARQPGWWESKGRISLFTVSLKLAL
jgi:hypothetical protein